MSQARPMAWWRQARNDLDLAPPHTHGLPRLVEVLEHQGVDASGLEDSAPMDLFEPSDSEQAITTATAPGGPGGRSRWMNGAGSTFGPATAVSATARPDRW
jgi:hypothetical protein